MLLVMSLRQISWLRLGSIACGVSRAGLFDTLMDMDTSQQTDMFHWIVYSIDRSFVSYLSDA